MRTLRVFKLTEDAENRGIDWNNFEDTDIETVEEIEVDDEEVDIEEIAINAGYGDTDLYGYECM